MVITVIDILKKVLDIPNISRKMECTFWKLLLHFHSNSNTNEAINKTLLHCYIIVASYLNSCPIYQCSVLLLSKSTNGIT